MNIIVDRIIYRLTKTGGIRRYFDGFLPLLCRIDKKVKVEFLPTQSTGDIFHSTYYTRHPDKNISQVVTVHDMIHEKFPDYFPGIKNYIFRRRKRKVIESADAVICVSENTKKDVLKYYQLDKSKVYVIYHGKDNVFRKNTGKKSKNNFLKKYKIKKPYLFYLGPRGRYKNFLKFVKAYALWKGNKKLNLLIAGGGSFSKQEIKLFKQLKIRQKIKNFGYISDKDLASFYNYAHAFVYPSLYEGFGIPLVEAMACGTLVLASNKSSFPEVGKDCFIYFNPEETTSIKNALDRSLSEKTKKSLIEKSLKRAKYFSWQNTAKQILKIYKTVTKKN